MQINLIDAVGYAAASLTTISFVPQVIRSWQSKDLTGVSLLMYSFFTLGVALWLMYGILLESFPVVVANTITLLLASMVLFLKIKHK